MPELYTCISTAADICAEPQEPAVINRRDSQLLYGEVFAVQPETPAPAGWVFGRSVHDDYQGFVKAPLLLAPQTKAATHKVCVALTDLYPAPDFKTRPLMQLGFQSRLHIHDETPQNGFAKSEGGWVFAAHIKKENEAQDVTAQDLAGMFLPAPYLYGGRSALGVDCSGLVQLWLMARGIACPRDSDQQAGIGMAVESTEDLRAGDLVFFPGHVGIMINNLQILNATARKMATVIEPLSSLEEIYGPTTALRRVL